MYIAFFDSGVGGLSVLNLALRRLPNERFIYFADTDNVPYGIKTADQIREYVLDAISYLDGYKLKALVVACNTATSSVIEVLREKYTYPIIGMEPAIKPASLATNKKILLFATDYTLQEEKLNRLATDLDIHDRLHKMSLQELVLYAEYFDLNNPEIPLYLEKKFDSLDWDEYGAVVLGCTHFLFFKDLIKRYVPDHQAIIDGHNGTINRLMSLIKEENIGYNGAISYFQSGREKPHIYYDHYLRYLNETL